MPIRRPHRRPLPPSHPKPGHPTARVAAVLMLLVVAAPVAAHRDAGAAAASTLAFAPVADARVEEARPGRNFGAAPTLRADGGDPDVLSYLRFRVGGVNDRVARATLRLFVPDKGGTSDGPKVFRARNDWNEAKITWHNRPSRTRGPYDDADAIDPRGWIELDVTPAVGGDGTVTFLLLPQSGDGTTFLAREGANPPQLVVETDDAADGGEDPATVTAAVETDPVRHEGDAADDVALWIHPTDPTLSTIIGTDKLGGLAVYDLAGAELAYYPGGEPNNVDLRYNVPLGSERVALVVASDAATDSLRVYRVDPDTRELADVGARTIDIGIGAAGLCLYASPSSGRTYAFVGDNSGTVQQWELFDDGTGKVDAAKVRTLSLGSTTEGCVADDATGDLYVAEEEIGIWKYGAEPGAGSTRTQVDGVGNDGHLTADIEGLALYYRADGGGYLLASSQGDDSFVVYERGGSNAYVTTFAVGDGAVDGVSHTDGLDVTNVALGAAFPDGLFAAQDDRNDGGNQNFKLVSWGDIARAFDPPLTIDPGWDPRVVGG